MNGSDCGDQPVSVEYSDIPIKRQREEEGDEEKSCIKIDSDPNNITSSVPQTLKRESHPPANQPTEMTRDYASQPQRTLPGIYDILGETRQPDSDATPWASHVYVGPPHSRSSSQSWTSEAIALGSRPPIVNPRGELIHPPMVLDPDWTYLNPSDRYDYGRPSVPAPMPEHMVGRPQRPASDPSHKPGKSEWGHTKSGNPRKRQPEACENCRHKKIKCELPSPGYNEGPRQCAHCEKTGIDCKWRNQPMYLANHIPDNNTEAVSSTRPSIHDKFQSSISSQGSPQTPSPKLSPTTSSRRNAYPSNGATNDDASQKPLHKKPRVAWQNSDDNDYFGSCSSDTSRQKVSLAIGLKESDIDIDPFETDKEVAEELLNNYFMYHDHSTDKILPRTSFTSWCRGDTHKSKADLILVYATLALGSIFGTTKMLKDRGKPYAELSKFHLNRFPRYSLKVALARLHLAAFFWAEGDPNQAFECTNWGVIVSGILGYNTEKGCLDGVSSAAEENDFGFTSVELIECRRRVFWHGYISSRLKPFGSCFTQGPCDPDVLVRVPNLEQDYESGRDSSGPFFNAGSFDTKESGLTATKVCIASIWGTLMAQHRRWVHCSRDEYLTSYESFYEEISQRLEDWLKALPEELQYSPENIRKSIKGGNFVDFYVINACYHMAMMKLNRHARVDCLPSETISRNIARARKYARQFLELVSFIVKSDDSHSEKSNHILAAAACQPFALEAIMFACDILSSKGHVSAVTEVQSFLGHANTVFTESSRVFSSSKRQKTCVQTRLSELGAHAAMKDIRRPKWSFEKTIEEKHPPRDKLEQAFLPKNMDLVYEAKEELYFEALATR